MTPLRYKNVRNFSCTIFRKNFNQIFSQGGLWDEAEKMYRGIHGSQKKPGDAAWVFNAKDGSPLSRVDFRHIERYDEVHKFQGSQICELCCEENTPILMSDGSYKKIKDIKIGDVVKTLTGCSPVTAIGRRQLKECVEVRDGDNLKQIQSYDHKILTKRGWVSYRDLLAERDNGSRALIPSEYYCEPEYALVLPLKNRDFSTPPSVLQMGLLQTQKSFAQVQGYQYSCLRGGHISSGFHPLSFSEPTGYCSALQSSSQRLMKFRAHLPRLDNCIFHQVQTGEASREGLRHQAYKGVFSCTALKGQDICSLSSVGAHREHDTRALTLLPKVPFGLTQQLVGREPQDTEVHGESSNALSVIEVLNCQGSCSAYSDPYDGRPHHYRYSGRSSSLQLNDAVIHSPIYSHLGDQGKIHKCSRRVLLYEHPYTSEVTQSELGMYDLRSLTLTPVGKRFVIDITVDSDNHYITESGLVNKNCFDELTHFDRDTFFYMLSRNRSACGVKPFVRATCNPDADSWVAEFINWWIDQDTGYPIKERSGVLRYFVRRDDQIYWANTKKELWEKFDLNTDEERAEPRSVTFIMSSVYDNQELLRANPQYLANLKALATIERERLLMGNWKIKPSAGLYFRREQLGNILPFVPDDVVQWVRCWDLAATEKDENNDPAYTAGVLMGKRRNGRYVVADVINRALSASDVRNTIRLTAQIDNAKYKQVRVRIPQDPGQAGKDQAQLYIKYMSGFDITAVTESGSKESRATPMAAQWQAGNFDIVSADWNEAYLNQLEGFPDMKLKDMVDASANGFAELELKSQFNLANFF